MLALTVPRCTVSVSMLVEFARAEGLLYLFDIRINTAIQARHVDVTDALGGKKTASQLELGVKMRANESDVLCSCPEFQAESTG